MSNDPKNKNEEFWDVFISDVPRVPSVDELICRAVAIHYPRGIVTDVKGADILTPRNAGTVAKTVLATVERAVEMEKGFWMRQLRYNYFYTPYSWGVRFSANIAIMEAQKMIVEALGHVGNIRRLDQLFWDAYRRTEALCEIENRQLRWRPFKK